MLSTAILALSILFQLTAVALVVRIVVSLRLWVTGSIAVAALALMTARRGITLFHSQSGAGGLPPDVIAETVALAISALMVAAIMRLGRLLHELNREREDARHDEAAVRAIVDHASDGIVTIDESGHVQSFNGAAERIFGYGAAEIVGRPATVLVPTPEGEPEGQHLRNVAVPMRDTVATGATDILGVRKDGTSFPIGLSVGEAQVNGLHRFVAVIRDISQFREMERALRRSQARLQEAQRIGRIGNWELDLRTRTAEWSDELYRLLGLPPRRGPIGLETFLDRVHPEDRPAVMESVERALDGETPGDLDFRVLLPGGSERILRARAELRADPDGVPTRLVGTSQDVTELREAERALRVRESQLRGLVDYSPMSIVFKDRERRIQIVNRRFAERYGVDPAVALGRTASEILPPDYAALHDAMDRDVLEKRLVIEREAEASLADGAVHVLELTKFPVLDSRGEMIGIGSIGLEVTRRRQAEMQLQQAQRLEAVGQLTGGIAHDFNNLLSAILGNLELVQPHVVGAPRVAKYVETALRATYRGADLTQRLLTFARKQPTSPMPTNVNDLITGLNELLLRTLGENVEIDLALDRSTWSALVDPNQLESVLINLAVNARDAMPDGGHLTIETADTALDEDYAARNSDVTPGRYVMIAVTDTGTGMAPDVIEHVFEPFFTTKEPGKGTGLGLSMAYGFAKQCGGHIRIYSEPGLGTTVRLYLPRARGEELSAVERAANGGPMPTGTERILLAEDNDDVRAFFTTVLDGLGYEVIEAESGAAALDRLEEIEQLDLLLTDVVMPGINGPQLALRVRERFPEIKIVFVSGYAEDALTHQGRMQKGLRFLAKPCPKESIARTVRHALDDPAG